MNTTPAAPYKGHRFPQEIISHAVWLYYRFSLSYRDVEELLAERGIMVTYETVRQWCRKFGQQLFHVAVAQRKPVVEPDSVADDLDSTIIINQNMWSRPMAPEDGYAEERRQQVARARTT